MTYPTTADALVHRRPLNLRRTLLLIAGLAATIVVVLQVIHSSGPQHTGGGPAKTASAPVEAPVRMEPRRPPDHDDNDDDIRAHRVPAEDSPRRVREPKRVSQLAATGAALCSRTGVRRPPGERSDRDGQGNDVHRRVRAQRGQIHLSGRGARIWRSRLAPIECGPRDATDAAPIGSARELAAEVRRRVQRHDARPPQMATELVRPVAHRAVIQRKSQGHQLRLPERSRKAAAF